MFTTHDGYGWFMALFYQRKPLKYTQNHMFDLIPAKKCKMDQKISTGTINLGSFLL
jgi:hypothetical protein